ncbi:MAG: transposase [Sulfurovum sp.]|nr:transposase [Sulfurovum sp.]
MHCHCIDKPKYLKNRFGVPFSDTTLSNWMIKASEKLKPFKQRLKERLLENEYIQADETTLQVVNAHKSKATKKSYIWLGVGQYLRQNENEHILQSSNPVNRRAREEENSYF